MARATADLRAVSASLSRPTLAAIEAMCFYQLYLCSCTNTPSLQNAVHGRTSSHQALARALESSNDTRVATICHSSCRIDIFVEHFSCAVPSSPPFLSSLHSKSARKEHKSSTATIRKYVPSLRCLNPLNGQPLTATLSMATLYIHPPKGLAVPKLVSQRYPTPSLPPIPPRTLPHHNGHPSHALGLLDRARQSISPLPCPQIPTYRRARHEMLPHSSGSLGRCVRATGGVGILPP